MTGNTKLIDPNACARAIALMALLDSDFGQSGADVRLAAIVDELRAAYARGYQSACDE